MGIQIKFIFYFLSSFISPPFPLLSYAHIHIPDLVEEKTAFCKNTLTKQTVSALLLVALKVYISSPHKSSDPT